MLALPLLVAPLAAEAQAAGVHRVGYLLALPSSATTHLREAFRHGLRELGYVEGHNIVIEFRNADGIEQLPALATELVRLNVDVIVAAPDVSIQAAKEATRTIPIVMAVSLDDPVERGFVASLARPGGNITGLSSLQQALLGKSLEILKEVVPKLSRVAVLWTADSPSQAAQVRALEVAAGALGVALQFLSLRGPNPDFERALRAATRDGASALLSVAGPMSFEHRARIVDLTAQSHLPGLHEVREFVEAGGLMAYGPSLSAMHRRAASYVDRILKGTKPADLPVEQPTKFELVINLKTAKALGITVPPSLLLLSTYAYVFQYPAPVFSRDSWAFIPGNLWSST
jgi:putative ABC transport system substrate-binding protein